MFCAGELDLGPVLRVMGRSDKCQKQPKICSMKRGPAESSEAANDNQDMKEQSPGVFELQGMDLVKLKDEIPDEMAQ